MIAWIRAGACLCLMAGAEMALANGASYSAAEFSDMPGWERDDHGAALETFVSTCDLIRPTGWQATCDAAKSASDARGFLESAFAPVRVEDGKTPLFTAYYEPEIAASLTPDARFKFPIYAKPPELPSGKRWFTRAELENGPMLRGRGLEIAYLEDPVENFFLHVQGSGRLRLPDGSALRVGFAAKNGHKYRSVGREMARRGYLPEHRLSAGAIKSWVRKNPQRGREVLQHNQSFIFFRELKNLPADKGPLGAMNRPVTAMRSIAVDPDFVPLGAPVWVQTSGKMPVERLMIAQDTGSAITGAQRADIFVGSGAAAGKIAGQVRDQGAMFVLMPKAMARTLTGS